MRAQTARRPVAADRAPTRRQVIDTDVHEMPVSARDLLPFLDPAWHQFIRSGWATPYFFSYGYPTEAGFARVDAAPDRGGPAGSDLELMQRQLLDAYDVDTAILTSLFFPSDSHVQFEFATALARAYNDWLAENWLSRDSRLRGSVCVNVNDPAGAAAEIDRVAKRGQVVQVMLPPLHEGYGHPRYAPIFDAAVRNGLVAGLHPSAYAPTAIGYPQYLIEWRILAPVQHHMAQVVSIVCSGLFERHPDLRVALIEGGWTWLPALLGRFDENYRSLRREVPWLTRMPSEYVREHMRFSTQPLPELGAGELQTIIEQIGSDELLMFSSDYPHFDADDPYLALPRLPEDLRHKIQYSNAKSFYQL